MASLFQRLFASEEEERAISEERPVLVEVAPQEAREDARQDTREDLAESSAEAPSQELDQNGQPVLQTLEPAPENLIPASQLPSAANSLAELFAEPSPPEESHAASIEPEIEPPAPPPQIAEQTLADEPPRRRGMFSRLFAVKRPKKVRAEETPVAEPDSVPVAEATTDQTPVEIEMSAGEGAVSCAPGPIDEILAIEADPATEQPALAPQLETPPVPEPPDDAFEWDTIRAEIVEAAELLLETPTAAPIESEALPQIDAPIHGASAAVRIASTDSTDDQPSIIIEAQASQPEPLQPEHAPIESEALPQIAVQEDVTVLEFASDPEKTPASAPAIESPDELAESAQPLSQTAPEPAPAPAAPAAELPEPPRRSYQEWAFDEKLASHAEWLESHGATGKKADLSGAELEAIELIGVNLRMADLHDANLRGSDLLLADLREACLVRADLEEASLVGANLEGANLEGASLETSMGLVPRQFAGANLRDALLSPQLMEFEAVPAFERASQNASHYFFGMSALSVISWLLIWRTRDIQLLTDSAVLPFLHSRAAAAALPTDESYLIVPVALFVLYLVFHFHLQHMWDSVAELPAVFPDGHSLPDRAPGIIPGLLRAHFRWMNPDPTGSRLVEKSVSLLAAYWVVPGTLLLFWLRYLTRQDMHGTLLHVLLVVAATAIAFYATTKVGRPHQSWQLETKWSYRFVKKMKNSTPASLGVVLGAILLFLSVGTISGVPHDLSRAPQYRAASVRRWAPDVLWYLSFDPYADLTESAISRRPSNGPVADDQVASVDGLRMNNADFRYVQAYGAFLANSHLWHADMQGAFLSDADLRAVDLGESNLRYTVMDHAQMVHVNLYRSNLDGADLRRANLSGANLSYASLKDATLVDTQLDGANLYAAHLIGATLTRANLQKADLRESSLNIAHMQHVDLRGAYLWSAKVAGADMGGAQLANAILIGADLRGVNLGGAQLSETVLNDADLSGSSLEGADLRGALGLTANQICSAKSRRGAQLDEALETQVEAQCGPAK